MFLRDALPVHVHLLVSVRRDDPAAAEYRRGVGVGGHYYVAVEGLRLFDDLRREGRVHRGEAQLERRLDAEHLGGLYAHAGEYVRVVLSVAEAHELVLETAHRLGEDPVLKAQRLRRLVPLCGEYLTAAYVFGAFARVLKH